MRREKVFLVIAGFHKTDHNRDEMKSRAFAASSFAKQQCGDMTNSPGANVMRIMKYLSFVDQLQIQIIRQRQQSIR